MTLSMDRLIAEQFGGVDAYADARSVSAETKRKWRQRGVPLSELASALLILEADRGRPVAVSPYKMEGESCSRTRLVSTGEPLSPFD